MAKCTLKLDKVYYSMYSSEWMDLVDTENMTHTHRESGSNKYTGIYT